MHMLKRNPLKRARGKLHVEGSIHMEGWRKHLHGTLEEASSWKLHARPLKIYKAGGCKTSKIPKRWLTTLSGYVRTREVKSLFDNKMVLDRTMAKMDNTTLKL